MRQWRLDLAGRQEQACFLLFLLWKEGISPACAQNTQGHLEGGGTDREDRGTPLPVAQGHCPIYWQFGFPLPACPVELQCLPTPAPSPIAPAPCNTPACVPTFPFPTPTDPSPMQPAQHLPPPYLLHANTGPIACLPDRLGLYAHPIAVALVTTTHLPRTGGRTRLYPHWWKEGLALCPMPSPQILM